MRTTKLLRVGAIGTVITAICCFTPALVIIVVAIGLSAVVGWLDYVLYPALAVFAGITVYALIRRRREKSAVSNHRPCSNLVRE